MYLQTQIVNWFYCWAPLECSKVQTFWKDKINLTTLKWPNLILFFNINLLKSRKYSPGGLLRLIFAGYVPLGSYSPYPIIVYSVANYRPHLKALTFARSYVSARFSLVRYSVIDITQINSVRKERLTIYENMWLGAPKSFRKGNCPLYMGVRIKQASVERGCINWTPRWKCLNQKIRCLQIWKVARKVLSFVALSYII